METATEFELLASVAEVPEGGVIQRIRSTGEAVCLVRKGGVISALSDICTHQHFSMSKGEILHDGTLQCAWHGAKFDPQTGEVRQGPAEAPLPVYEVRIEGQGIFVGPRSRRVMDRYEPVSARVNQE